MMRFLCVLMAVACLPINVGAETLKDESVDVYVVKLSTESTVPPQPNEPFVLTMPVQRPDELKVLVQAM
jgi:hypothetical protein